MADTTGLTTGKGGARLSLAASLVWPIQAWLVAAVLADLLTGAITVSLPVAITGFVALGMLRATLEAKAQRYLSHDADEALDSLRHEIIAGEARTNVASNLGDAGALAALLAEKLEALRPYLLRYRPARYRAMVVPLVILALSFWQSWAIGLVLLIAGPLIPLFMALVGWAAKDASAKQMIETGALSDLLVDRLAAMADLRLLGEAAPVIAGFAEASESLRARTMAVLRIAFLSSTVLELFAALGVAMVAVWTGFSLLGVLSWGTWGPELTPLAGIWLLLLAPEFFQPLRDLASAWHDKAAAEAVLDEVDSWRAEARPDLLGRGDACEQMVRADIALTGVKMQLGAQVVALPDLVIRPGESVAIMGPSGAGKSTLLRVIAGLERPVGRVEIGGRVLDDPLADGWRAGIGWMPQAPHFLNRSLRHNITFGAPLRADIIEQARLDNVIAGLPNGAQTLLGERGAGLSGGEARRVMLARALHGGPQVLLADEPTADLDAQTADAVAAGLLDFAATGGTLIVATHDASLARRLDRTVVLGPET